MPSRGANQAVEGMIRLCRPWTRRHPRQLKVNMLERPRRISPGKKNLAVAILVAAAAVGCARAPVETTVRPGEIGTPMDPLPVAPETFMDTAQSAYVLVDLDHNILRFMDGDEIVWEAPVGTGTGLRLQAEDGHWEFSTPTGVFQVKYKEEMPVWYLPDWYFIENDLPIPPNDSPSRRLENQLGVAAVYLGEEIAIHGTNRPELLGKRVSHGCIRLENKFAQRLYHNVQIGTPIVIVGGEKFANIPPEEAPPATPRPTPPDPLGGVATATILDRLKTTLAAGDTTGAWVPLASRLITRGLKDDATALRGLLSLAGTAKTDRLNREYATFLADTYSRGALRVVVSLARIDEESRDRATKAIVSATMRLYAGTPLDERAPWPTNRFHNSVLGPEGRAGWESLLAAEEAFRAEHRRSASAGTRGS